MGLQGGPLGVAAHNGDLANIHCIWSHKERFANLMNTIFSENKADTIGDEEEEYGNIISGDNSAPHGRPPRLQEIGYLSTYQYQGQSHICIYIDRKTRKQDTSSTSEVD